MVTSVTLPIDMYSCGLLLDIAMQKSNLGVFLYFPLEVSTQCSGAPNEKELFGKELRTKQQYYIIMH